MLVMAQTFYAPKQANVKMLSAYPQNMAAIVSSQTITLNRQNKRSRLSLNINSQLTKNTDTNRTPSVKSGFTTITKISNKDYNSSANQNLNLNKNSKLVDFLKNDTTLGRDQQIGAAGANSLEGEGIQKRLKAGVSLTQFAPTREKKQYHQHDNDLEQKEFSSQPQQPKHLTFE